jgi:hypothetical protein
VGQSVPIKGLPEVGQIAVVRTAEGSPVGGCSGENDGLRIAQGIDEAAGVTGGNDDHPPFDA